MKLRHLLVCAAAVLAVGSFAACGQNSSSSSKPDGTKAPTEESGDAATEAPTEAQEPDDKVTYTVKVVDEDGNAIADAMVQICSESCIPGKTDANGVAEFKVDKDEYHASLMKLPDGYDYTTEETEFYFDGDATELTITLKAQ